MNRTVYIAGVRGLLSLIILMICGSGFTVQASGKADLAKFFKDLKGFSATFEQQVQNPQLSVTDQASGKLWIDRPGKFRWDYQQPYQQQIISNGLRIWIYDVDLEQVTVKEFDDTVGQTPALLLSSEEPLETSFRIKESGELEGLNWVILFSKNQDAGFTSIQLGFKDGVLAEMWLKDNLDQTTQLVLKDVKRNPKMAASMFELDVPETVDIYDAAAEVESEAGSVSTPDDLDDL